MVILPTQEPIFILTRNAAPQRTHRCGPVPSPEMRIPRVLSEMIVKLQRASKRGRVRLSTSRPRLDYLEKESKKESYAQTYLEVGR